MTCIGIVLREIADVGSVDAQNIDSLDEFERERSSRDESSFDASFVVPITRSINGEFDGKHVLCPDIGADKIWIFDLLSCGAFYWITDGFPGRATDPEMVEHGTSSSSEIAALLDLFHDGMDALIDKGFMVKELLQAKGSIGWMPPSESKVIGAHVCGS